MSEKVTCECPSCGAKVESSKNINSINCEFCGTPFNNSLFVDEDEDFVCEKVSIENNTLDLSNKKIANIKSILKLYKDDEIDRIHNLNVSNNNLKTLENIQCFNNLKTLDASSNVINQMPNLNGFNNLISIDLNDNKISEIGGVNSRLNNLNLTKNNITKISNDFYTSILPLSIELKINISGNPITENTFRVDKTFANEILKLFLENPFVIINKINDVNYKSKILIDKLDNNDIDELLCSEIHTVLEKLEKNFTTANKLSIIRDDKVDNVSISKYDWNDIANNSILHEFNLLGEKINTIKRTFYNDIKISVILFFISILISGWAYLLFLGVIIFAVKALVKYKYFDAYQKFFKYFAKKK